MKIPGVRLRTNTIIKAVLEYAICFFLIYLSGSASISVNEEASSFRIMSLLICLLCTLYYLIFIRTKSTFTKDVIIMSMLAVYFVIEFLIYRKTIFGLLLRGFWIFSFILILLSKKVDPKVVYSRIYNVIVFVATISLLMFILVNLVKANVPYDYVASGQDLTFYRRYMRFFYVSGIYLMPLPVFGIRVYRLQSLFWEPGVYAIYLIFAMYYFVFLKRDKRIVHLAILLVSIVLTFSTTGICLGIGLFGVFWIRTSKLSNRIKVLTIIPIVVIAAIGIYIVWTTKKLDSNHVNGSYYLRIHDIIDGIKLIAQRPILGWGYKNYAVFERLNGIGRGSSNGIITLGYTMGIVGLAVVIIPFILVPIQCGRKRRIDEIVYSLIFLLTNMTEPVIYLPFMIFLVLCQYRKCGCGTLCMCSGI